MLVPFQSLINFQLKRAMRAVLNKITIMYLFQIGNSIKRTHKIYNDNMQNKSDMHCPSALKVKL